MKASPTLQTSVLWFTRISFLVVFGWNILCALQFITQPDVYAPAYQLTGPAGSAAVQGIGIAFLMWNATYPLFIINPRKWTVLGFVIIAQQIIGLVGECFVLFNLPSSGFLILSQSIQRFIAFDAAGLILMTAALVVFYRISRKNLLK